VLIFRLLIYGAVGESLPLFSIAKITHTSHYKYVYDGQGNIVRSIDITFKKEYNYEYEDGKIVRATESDIIISNEIVTSKTVANTIRYYYDSEGTMNKKVITAKDGTVQTIYYEQSENDSQVVKFTAGGRTVTSHSKTDSFGRKVFDELQLGTDFVSRQFVYHAGKVTDEHKEKAKVKSSATTQLVSQIILSNGTTLSYGYDAEERITSVVEAYEIDGVPVTNTTLYTYDALGQLLTETVNGTVVNTMTYDNYGNIQTKNGVEYTYGDENWKDLLTGCGDQTITYDKQGNPTNYLGHTLTWEKGRQLKSFEKVVNGTKKFFSYTYNANGIRTSKTVDGIRHDFVLDGAKILSEGWNFDETINTYRDILVPLYDNEESVCGIVYNNAPYYFHKNLQGDIIGIVDKNADVVARYTYDAWGVCTVTQDSVGIAQINPFRYRGYYYDEEIGMYYLQSRYYDPEIGRFVNGDMPEISTIGGDILGHNLFAYCGNNVITNADVLGYFSIPRAIITFGVDAVIWAVFSAGAATFAFLTQPIKALARYAGKAFIKCKMLGILRGFSKTLANAIVKVAKFLVPIIKKAVGWLFRNWAAKLSANKLAETIAGGLMSLTANSFLNTIVSNITLCLSLGGIIGGLWDWWSDKKLNGWIKLW